MLPGDNGIESIILISSHHLLGVRHTWLATSPHPYRYTGEYSPVASNVCKLEVGGTQGGDPDPPGVTGITDTQARGHDLGLGQYHTLASVKWPLGALGDPGHPTSQFSPRMTGSLRGETPHPAPLLLASHPSPLTTPASNTDSIDTPTYPRLNSTRFWKHQLRILSCFR